MSVPLFSNVLQMLPTFTPPYTIPNPDTVRRLRKRINSFTAILRTPEYHAVYSLWSHGQIHIMPWSPDPFDLTVSKREWEASVQAWRNELKLIARIHTTSVEVLM